jgi:hypothetical protein
VFCLFLIHQSSQFGTKIRIIGKVNTADTLNILKMTEAVLFGTASALEN